MPVRRRRDIWDVAIVGGGIAGLVGALQASARGLSTVLVEAALPGGLVATVNVLEDWPSAAPESGAGLAARLAAQARLEDVSIIDGRVDALLALGAGDARFELQLADRRLRARSVLCASGARLAPLGLPGEERFHGRGWSQCAWCDGAFFRDRDVVVVGGGDSALQQALVLAPLVRSVTVAVRGQLRARHARIERASGQPNLRFAWNTVVRGLVGIDALEAVQLERVDDGMRTELPCSGLFPFVGLLPATGWLPDTVVRDPLGHVVTDRDGRSSLPGLHAVGAARSGGSGDLVGAAGDAAGAIAALARELQR
jgi:thioredoxin reductase (NADPH)